MSVRPILHAPDERLRIVSSPVDAVDDDIRQLVKDMFATMYAAPAAGWLPFRSACRSASS